MGGPFFPPQGNFWKPRRNYLFLSLLFGICILAPPTCGLTLLSVMIKYHQIISLINSINIPWELTNSLRPGWNTCSSPVKYNPVKSCTPFSVRFQNFLLLSSPFLPLPMPAGLLSSIQLLLVSLRESSFLVQCKIRKKLSVMSQMCLPQESLFRKSLLKNECSFGKLIVGLSMFFWF